VSGTVTISDDGATFDGNIVGKGLVPVDITCNAEQFTVGAKGKINLPTVGTAGDCLHDGLQKYSVKLKEVDYDAKKDTITLHVKDIIPITIVLKHQAVAALTPARHACEWTTPSSTGFAGVTFDLNALPTDTLEDGTKGYNITGKMPMSRARKWDYIFGICAEVNRPDTPGCALHTAVPEKAVAWQVGRYNATKGSEFWTTCNALAEDDSSLKHATGAAFSLVDPTNPVAGVRLTWNGGSTEACPSSQFSVSFVCSLDYVSIGHQRNVVENTMCQSHVEVKTAYGCPAQCKRGSNGLLCSGHGTCGYSQSNQQAMCLCDSGFTGQDCSALRTAFVGTSLRGALPKVAAE
jgi:hypothetical protein